VKTRLAAEIGDVGAAGWYRRQTARLLRELCTDPRWRTILAIAPDIEVKCCVWPKTVPRIGQGQGDIGLRMIRLLRNAGPGKAVLIARDGGFWLIGVRNAAAALPAFPNATRWSTEHTLEDAAAPFHAWGNLALCDTLDDVDTADDMRRVKAQTDKSGWI